MRFVICLLLSLALIAVPAQAVEVTEVSTEPSAPAETESDTITDIPEEMPMPLLVTGSLSGGYYFVADTSLGDSMKFYVPLEWAHDAFALDASGAPVNMSNSTCYAYCEELPSYTFSCSRFGTFVYRSSDYSTTDLEITNISDTNIQFLKDESVHLSDSDLLLLISALLFFILTWSILCRR